MTSPLHSRKSSLKDEVLLSIEEELRSRLTPGLDTAQQVSKGPVSGTVTSQLFEVSAEDDVIVRRDFQFTLPIHSPLLRSTRPSIALALADSANGTGVSAGTSTGVSTAITRNQLLSTPVQQPQQPQQLHSPYIRMCAQLESFVDRETELADELLMHCSATDLVELTPELERARLGYEDTGTGTGTGTGTSASASSTSSTLPTTNNNKKHSSVPTGSTRSLWLGNLDPTLTESDLHDAFSPFGPIELVRLLPAKECAFVNFYALEDALRAKERMNGCALGNLILRIGFGKIDSNGSNGASASNSSTFGDSRSIWIGNVGPEVLEEDLLLHFAPYGPIESCRVLSGKGCAFVNFYGVENASMARQAMNGAIIGSSVIKTGYAKDSTLGGSSNAMGTSAMSTSALSTGVTTTQSTTTQSTTSQSTTSQSTQQPTFASIIGGPVSPTPSSASSSASASASASPFDTATLKDLRRAIEFNPLEEIPRMLAQFSADLRALARDPYGNILLQKVIKLASPHQLHQITQELLPELPAIGMNKNGTWVIQKLLSCALPPLQSHLFSALQPCTVEMLEDQFGNYVIQVALQSGGEEVLMPVICTQARRLATGRFSSRALKSILESTACPPRPLLTALAKEAVWLAIDGNGVIVLQWILDCREVPGRMGLIGSMLQGRVPQIALTKQGSAIIARLIGSTEEPSARDAVITELFNAQDTQLLDLLREGCTCAILCKAFQMSKPALRIQFASNLAPKLMQVLQEQTGKSVEQLRDPQLDHSDVPLHLSRLHQEVILNAW